MTAPAAPRSFTVDGEEYVRVPADELAEGDLDADSPIGTPMEAALEDEEEHAGLLDHAVDAVGGLLAGAVRSQNGWPANDRSLIASYVIPGTSRKMALRKGDAAFVLCDFFAWFDKNIESIDNDGELDDWGYAERKVRGSSSTVSNHASGTAGDLNAPEHPLGVRNTFTPEQRRKINAKLKEYDGCIRAGMNYESRPDDMHFELDKGPADVARCAKKLRSQATVITEKGDRWLGVQNPILRGQDVLDVQDALIRDGYRIVRDGAYGTGTARAVGYFQKKHGIVGERGCGPKTWAALRKVPR